MNGRQTAGRPSLCVPMPNRKLVTLAAAYLVLALATSLLLPLFEGPDEDDHFRLAKFIADHRALPVQEFATGGGEAGHQGWQPPLYYTLAAALIAPLDTTDFPQHLWRNEGATFVGDPACCGRNLYYHTANENFPFTGTTLAVHWLRVFSALLGLVTVLSVYATVRVLAPGEAGPALLGAAVVAFNPSFLFASALVSNDAPLAALSALVLLAWVKLLAGQWALSVKSALGLGALLGVAVLVKTTAIGLVPFSILVVALAALRRGDRRLIFSANVALVAAALILSGGWFIRNQVLYGDPLAMRLLSVSALFPRAGPLTLAELFQISLPWLWQTFWGGPTPGDFSPLLLTGLALLTALAAAGAVLAFQRRTEFTFRSTFLLLALWLGFILAAQIQFIRTTVGADQGRYLFPALAAFGLFFSIGLDEWVRRVPARLVRSRLSGWGAWAAALLFILPVAVLILNTLPAYARPALLSAQDLAQAPLPAQANFADRLALRGYGIERRVFKPGEILSMALYWQALAPMTESYRVFLHLIGVNDRAGGGVDVIPGRGAFPTVYWKPGDAYRDEIRLPIPSNALPGKYSIEVGLYPVGKVGDRMTVVESGDDRLILGQVKIAPREPAVSSPQVPVRATFGGLAALNGYDARREGDTVTIALVWQSVAPFDRDYKVFVHLLGADGSIVAQADRMPQDGNYPTSIWEPGEQVRDVYELALPEGTTGACRFAVGLYRPDTGVRLEVRTGESTSDHLVLNWPGACP